jgi:hypothetical protein
MAAVPTNVPPLTRKLAGAAVKPAGGSLFPGDFWDPRAHRRFWLDKGSAAIDSWLRSRAFRKLMQYGLHTAIAVARLQNRDGRLAAAPAAKPTRRLDSRAGRKDMLS